MICPICKKNIGNDKKYVLKYEETNCLVIVVHCLSCDRVLGIKVKLEDFRIL